MKRTFGGMLCFLCLSALLMQTAFAKQVTLTELKQQMPKRLQMNVTTKDGKTVAVYAPIIMPEGNTMPLILVQYMTFDLTDLHKHFPLNDESVKDDRPGAVVMRLYTEVKNNRLTGKVDSTTRARLAQGENPPDNAVTTDDIMAFIHENMERFKADASPDIRIVKATAKSGLYAMKKFKTPEGWTEYTIDEKKPVKNDNKGMWHLDLAQYMHGARILGDYYPYGSYQSPDNLSGFWSPTWFHVDYMDEDHFNVIMMAVKEVDVLVDDSPLLSFDSIKQCLEQRIKEGKLRSIYKLTLGYSGKIVKGDSFRNGFDLNAKARFVLVPE